jgi:hypothetical protein
MTSRVYWSKSFKEKMSGSSSPSSLPDSVSHWQEGEDFFIDKICGNIKKQKILSQNERIVY